MKVLILAAGPDDVTIPGRGYPVALSEFDGHPLIELTLRSVAELQDARVICAIREEESPRSHLDNIIKLIDPTIEVLRVRHGTAGAACTALLAIDHIDDDELLILNANEILDADFPTIVHAFRSSSATAGVVVFPAVHPRYSYVRIEGGLVIEAAEKRPISRSATAGFYWFRHGDEFVAGAMRMISKEASVGGLFYICPVLNELILDGKDVQTFAVQPSSYHPLKDDRQVYRYETNAGERRQ